MNLIGMTIIACFSSSSTECKAQVEMTFMEQGDE